MKVPYWAIPVLTLAACATSGEDFKPRPEAPIIVGNADMAAIFNGAAVLATTTSGSSCGSREAIKFPKVEAHVDGYGLTLESGNSQAGIIPSYAKGITFSTVMRCGHRDPVNDMAIVHAAGLLCRHQDSGISFMGNVRPSEQQLNDYCAAMWQQINMKATVPSS